MKSTLKKTIVTSAIVATLALGTAGAAVAATAPPTPGGASSTTEQSPAYVGSITAPAEAQDSSETADAPENAAAESAAESAESAALQSLATITPDQASAAATAAVPGKAGTPQLGNENGFVVYEVEVTATDGTITEVKIDAGNGAVLAQEAADAAESNNG